MGPDSEVEKRAGEGEGAERDSGTDVDEEAEYDADEPASEWHVWVAALLLVGGVAILLLPDELVPEFVAGFGPLFVFLAIVGWAGQWAYRRYR